MVWDGLARRLHVYNRDGDLVRESSPEKSQAGGLPLENGVIVSGDRSSVPMAGLTAWPLTSWAPISH
jgi:hypothetical protein